MEPDHLRLFLHLSESLNFSRTSRERNVPAPTLTRIIQRLEAGVGCQLFVRGRRFVELTAAGRAFAAYSRNALSEWETFRSGLGKAPRLAGELRMYCSVTASYTILPPVLRPFLDEHPDVHLTLTTGDAGLALDRVMRQEVDVAITPLSQAVPDELETLLFLESPLVFITSRTRKPLRKALETASPDWSKIPLILPEAGHLRQEIDAWLRARKAIPRVHSSVSGHEGILSLVNLGLGAGIIPLIVLQKSLFRSEVETADVSPPLPKFRVGFAARRSQMRRPIIAGFWEALRRAAEKNVSRAVELSMRRR